jgi:hypothetical protein
MQNKSFLKFLLFVSLSLHIFSDDKIDYDISSISSMKTSFFKTKSEKIYRVGTAFDSHNTNIIGFSDLDNNKYTDIITYNRENFTEYDTFIFYAYYCKNKGKKFSEGKELFNINITKNEKVVSDDISVRNLHVFSFNDKKKKPSFLISFNYINNTLLHYVITLDDDLIPTNLNIFSNILIMNKGDDLNLRLLYHDGQKRKICVLQKKEEEYLCKDEEYENYFDNITYYDKSISLNGGLGYADITGNCIPDIVLTHDNKENNQRIIEIYTAYNTNDKSSIRYNLSSIITLENSDDYGALVISRINDKEYRKNLPLLDILIPNIKENKIWFYQNKIKTDYKWSKVHCKENKNETKSPFEDKPDEIFNLTIDEVNEECKVTLDKFTPTVMRMGDFLGSSNPGILVKQNIDCDNEPIKSQISLFERKDNSFKYYAGFTMKGIAGGNQVTDELKMGLFYDIAESGTLSFIISTFEGKNYFFFNYRRNIFFIKSKLMNDEDYYFDSNLGATFRYIVTNKKGSRHMDISHQLTQTSDMNIPLPYSIMGLDDTNNYVEYFQTISGNIIKKKVSTKNSERNYKENTPIIPNTQMMISKYYNGDKIEWNVDLIVQPMEQIWIFLIIVIIVLLIVLGIIIYLHLKA